LLCKLRLWVNGCGSVTTNTYKFFVSCKLNSAKRWEETISNYPHLYNAHQSWHKRWLNGRILCEKYMKRYHHFSLMSYFLWRSRLNLMISRLMGAFWQWREYDRNADVFHSVIQGTRMATRCSFTRCYCWTVLHTFIQICFSLPRYMAMVVIKTYWSYYR